MKITIRTRTLKLKHKWTIARGSADKKVYNYIKLEHDGITGHGEAAHNPRYDESIESIAAFLKKAKSRITPKNITSFFHLIEDIHAIKPGSNAGKAALDLALFDWNAKRIGVPVHQLFGLDPTRTCMTSYSIGIDTPEMMQEKIRQAAGFPVYKIKLGGEDDEAIMRAVREVTTNTIRVDANEGWKDKETALEKMKWLKTLGVEFVEQPMPAGRFDDIAWLRERAPLPLVADEDVKTCADIPVLSKIYDGINIKLMKSGGLLEAFRMMLMARQFGLKIMLGCMVESSLAISAAAQLLPLVDWADLDGNLLISNDPFSGAQVENGKVIIPNSPGLGADLRRG